MSNRFNAISCLVSLISIIIVGCPATDLSPAKVSLLFVGEHFEEHNNNILKLLLVDQESKLAFSGSAEIIDGSFAISAPFAAAQNQPYTIYYNAEFVAGAQTACDPTLDHFFSAQVTAPGQGELLVTLEHGAPYDLKACQAFNNPAYR